MLFAVSPGSSGVGPPRFVASIPFILAPGGKLQLADNLTCHLGAETVTLDRMELRYVASLGPFDTAAEAEFGMERLRASLLWLSLELSIGLQYPKSLGTVQLFDAPIPIPPTEPMAYVGKASGWTETDGSYDGNVPTIRPDHKRLVRFEPGHANLIISISSPDFLSKIEQALRFPNISAVSTNSKLRLAIELYASHRFEVSTNAQFIALVTALEALLPDAAISIAAKEALVAGETAVLSVRDSHARDSEGWNEIERLLNRLRMLRSESIGASMRRFAAAVIERNPSLGDQGALTKLRDAYALRSRLLHDGHVDSSSLTSHLQFLKEFVPDVLRKLFVESSAFEAHVDTGT